MNCRPNDLAMFVNTENAGRMVRVIQRSRREDDARRLYSDIGVCWECEALSDIACWNKGRGGDVVVVPRGSILVCVPDSTIRPIRPGDISAEDVRELYAPKLAVVA